MKYESNTNGDFWDKFRRAAPHSLSLGIGDARKFASESVLILLGYKLYNPSECKAKPSDFVIKHFAEIKSCDTDSLTRCASITAITNAQKNNNRALVLKLEDALITGKTPQSDLDTKILVETLTNYIDNSSLWFHQKVFICYMAAKGLFLPDRSHQEKAMYWNRQRTYQHEELVTYYDRETHHSCLLSEKDWTTGGRNTVVDYFVDAYARELKELDFSKVDFSCFRDIFGSDYEHVIEQAKSILLADEFDRLNDSLKSLDSVNAALEKEKVLCLKLRDPVRRWIRTTTEEFYIAVWDNAAWRLHWADMALGTFLFKLFG